MADSLIKKLADKASSNANDLQTAVNTIGNAITTLGANDNIDKKLSISNAIKDMKSITHAAPVDNGVTDTHIDYIPLTEDVMPYGVKFYNQENPNSDLLVGKNASFRYGIDFSMVPGAIYQKIITHAYLDLSETTGNILAKIYCVMTTDNICIITLYKDGSEPTYAYSEYVPSDEIIFSQILILGGNAYIPISTGSTFKNVETGKACPYTISNEIYNHFLRAVNYDLKFKAIDDSTIAYSIGNELFICTLSRNRLSVSKTTSIVPRNLPGKEWDAINDLSNIGSSCVCYINNTWFIGVKSGTDLKVSSDGNTWTTATVGAEVNNVVYGNSLYVASTSAGIYTSSDGSTWTKDINIGDYVYNVEFDNETFVIFGDNIPMKYSTDGSTWQTPSIIDGLTINSVKYHSNIWIAATNAGAFYSTDNCAKWFATGLDNADNWKVCKYVNNAWYACNNSNHGLWFSYDGKSWFETNINSCNVVDIDYNNGIYVIITPGATNGAYYSRSGFKFHATNIPSTVTTVSLKHSDIWCITTTAGIYYSANGIDWTLTNNSTINSSVNCIATNDLIWIAGSNTTGSIVVSVNSTHVIYGISVDNGSVLVSVDNVVYEIDYSGTDIEFDVVKVVDNADIVYAASKNIFYTNRGVCIVDPKTNALTVKNRNITRVDNIIIYDNCIVGLDSLNGRILSSGNYNSDLHRPLFAQQDFVIKESYLDDNRITIPFNDFSSNDTTKVPAEIIILSKNNPYNMVQFRNTSLAGVNPYFVNGIKTNCIITFEDTDNSARKFFVDDYETSNTFDTNTRELSFLAPSGLVSYMNDNPNDIYTMYIIFKML